VTSAGFEKAFGAGRETIQFLAMRKRDQVVFGAVRDEDGARDLRHLAETLESGDDERVEKPESEGISGDPGYREVSRLEDDRAGCTLGGQLHRRPAAQRDAHQHDSLGRKSFGFSQESPHGADVVTTALLGDAPGADAESAVVVNQETESQVAERPGGAPGADGAAVTVREEDRAPGVLDGNIVAGGKAAVDVDSNVFIGPSAAIERVAGLAAHGGENEHFLEQNGDHGEGNHQGRRGECGKQHGFDSSGTSCAEGVACSCTVCHNPRSGGFRTGFSH
jgi:hypothetical protein